MIFFLTISGIGVGSAHVSPSSSLYVRCRVLGFYSQRSVLSFFYFITFFSRLFFFFFFFCRFWNHVFGYNKARLYTKELANLIKAGDYFLYLFLFYTIFYFVFNILCFILILLLLIFPLVAFIQKEGTTSLLLFRSILFYFYLFCFISPGLPLTPSPFLYAVPVKSDIDYYQHKISVCKN